MDDLGLPVSSWPTGAEVRQVAEFSLLSGASALVVVAGSTLQALTWDGHLLFEHADLVVSSILHVAATPDGPIALVLSRQDSVALIDLQTGHAGWRCRLPDGTRLSDAGSSKMFIDAGRLCWLAAPVYDESITCYEIDSVDEVRPRWVHDFAGRYDRGFGPAMIVTNALDDGSQRLVISSRTGRSYGGHGDERFGTPTERVVLGRDDGHLYQAVLDLSDGRVLREVAFRPDPGDYPCARPYGLLQAVAHADDQWVVLVACQVEEYFSVTRASGARLEREWGQFVEKDWPEDRQELRPQLTSLVEREEAEPLLVVGHFDSTRWHTLVRSAASGVEIAHLEDQYFWGVLPSAAGPLAVVSPATQRHLAGTEGLAAVTIDGLNPVGTAPELRPLTCSTDELPPHVTFHADRRSLVTLAHSGTVGILGNQGGRLVWWAPTQHGPVPLADVDATEAYPGSDGAVIVVAGNALHRVTTDLCVSEPVRVRGRRPDVLTTVAGATGWIANSVAGYGSEVRNSEGSWGITGRLAAMAAAGDTALVATITTVGSVQVWRCQKGGPSLLTEIRVQNTPTHVRFIRTDGVFIAEQTGAHTGAAGAYQLDGRSLWCDGAHWPYPNLPSIAETCSGRWIAAYDDHGVLIVRDAYTGELLAERDWTAAYTSPVLLPVDDTDLLLRLGGVHGIECLELTGGTQVELRERWRLSAPLWHYFPGDAAIARLSDRWVVGAMSPRGRLDLIDVRDGRVQHTVEVGPVAQRPPIVTVDDAGSAQFIVGTSEGRLLRIDADTGMLRPCPIRFSAAVECLGVARENDGPRDLLIGTADGMVHRLRLTSLSAEIIQ